MPFQSVLVPKPGSALRPFSITELTKEDRFGQPGVSHASDMSRPAKLGLGLDVFNAWQILSRVGLKANLEFSSKKFLKVKAVKGCVLTANS